MGKDERKSEFPKFDGRLRDAVTQRRVRLRAHRENPFGGMTMNGHFFNELKSHP